ncbi:MAG: hypothetical protein CME70_08960 [Halobacteriovorax sp.]|nr:hypothetical protein [Halobacteriovorax sp.]|tara:strand:- start:51517 stop:52002 length:486 start_codon:yes stop_codon:yes gene_type:complete
MGAEFSKEDIVVVNKELFSSLKSKAEKEKLKRFRLCLHKDHESPIQEMIIAINHMSYVQPHRHPGGRVESYSILEGELDVFIFDEEGKIKDLITLSSQGSSRILRIENNNWHMPIAKSEWAVYHEILEGPFVKDEVVEYADWAPEQDSKNAYSYRKELYGI